MGTNTILINGRAYDSITGLPVKATPRQSNSVFSDIGPRRTGVSAPAKPLQPRVVGTADIAVHARTQRSKTLNRSALHRPVQTPTQSPQIHRFATQPVAAKPMTATHLQVAPVRRDITPISKQVLHSVQQQPSVPTQSPNQVLKNQLIKERISEAEAAKTTKQKGGKLKRLLARQPRLVSFVAASFALLLLGGYITYINLPNLSVRVAASHAGINATYPEYRPDGYSLNGPVAYAPGQVTLSFKSNTNTTQNYSIKQRATSWDSQAVLDYVNKESHSQPTTFSEHGLTIYTYGTNAAWVNGGILYTVGGNAPLSSEQILKLASSM